MRSYCWKRSSIRWSSVGSAKVSLDFITSSSWWRRRVHSSMYILISTSISPTFVFLIFFLSISASSNFYYKSVFNSLIFLFKLIVKCDSTLSLEAPFIFPIAKLSLYYYSNSSINFSFLLISASNMCNRVLSFIFSSFKKLAVIFCFRASS